MEMISILSACRLPPELSKDISCITECHDSLQIKESLQFFLCTAYIHPQKTSVSQFIIYFMSHSCRHKVELDKRVFYCCTVDKPLFIIIFSGLYFQRPLMHRKWLTLHFFCLSPIMWRTYGLFQPSMTYTAAATVLLQEPGRGISFSHAFLHYTPLNRPLEPSGWIEHEAGTISLRQASSISQFIRFTKGVLFHWQVDRPLLQRWEQFY